MMLRLLSVVASVLCISLALSGTDVFAFGQKSDICGSWNNYCNGGTSDEDTSSGGFNQRQWEQQQERLRRQREAEARRHNRQQAHEAKDEAGRRAEEAARKFLREQQDAVSQLKGGGRFRIKSGTAVMGLKNPNPTGYLKGASASGARAITREWKQAHCGMWISGFTFPAAGKGDVAETRYLGEQAMKAFSGGPPELDCPSPPAPPDIAGRALTGRDSPFIKFQEAMLAATLRQAEKINAANKALTMAKIRQSAMHQEVVASEGKRNQLALEVKQAGAQGINSAAMEEKKRLLAAAEAALEKAKQAAAEVDATIAGAAKAKKAAEARLKVYNKLSLRVQAKPNLAGKLAARIGK